MFRSIEPHLSRISGQSTEVRSLLDTAKEMTPADIGWVAVGCAGAALGLIGEGIQNAYHATSEFIQLTRDFNRVHNNIDS